MTILTGAALIREREHGTIEHLLVIGSVLFVLSLRRFRNTISQMA